MQAIREFGPDYCGVSWGKDSVVVAHLCRRVDASIPLVYLTDSPWSNPDCGGVRDAFLSAHPGVYFEADVPAGRRIDAHGRVWPVWGDFRVAADRFGRRYISGIRSEESRTRRLRVAKWGTTTTNTCAPIARWTGRDVFAYLLRHDLPVHPAYAMSRGGLLERQWLRVAPLGGDRGIGMGRREWEMHYYQPELAALALGNTT